MESNNFPSMPTTYVVAICFLSISVLVSYRIFLHPLSKYPGPLLAKISEVYAGYYAISMNLHIRTRLDHLKYGPVLRHGPNRLIFNSPKALQDIYLNERLAKSYSYKYTAATAGVYGVFNVIDKSAHRFKRKLVGKALSDRSMRIFEPAMSGQIDIFLRILLSLSRESSSINMTHVIKRLTFDIVALLAFGRPLETQTKSTYRSLIEAQTAGNHRSNIFLQYPFIYHTKIFTLLEWFTSDKVAAYYHAIETMIASRVSEDKHARHDLYALIADEMNPNGECLKDSEIWAEAAFFFPAGADTVSALLCAAFFYLSRNTGAYTRLSKEIRSTFTTGTEIKIGPALAGCEYLRATLDETLRISPPASGTLWRELDVTDPSKEPFVVDGHVIPPGTQVGVNTYTLLHNEEYFPSPYEFRPERWFDSEMKQMQDAFQPFSTGTRSCAGKSMAYTEASLVLAKVVWHFDFEPAPGRLGKLGGGSQSLGEGRQRENEFQLYDVASATHDGPNLVFHLRDGATDDFMDEE
ncbi:cytochrome P450 [Hypoxylon cercidicola]|nr:cytochrome P450 [Hypoxylon cercidicola]